MKSRNLHYEERNEHSAKHLLCAGVALVSWLGTLAHNVPIIAAVADLKAQTFNFKTKVYE